MHSLISLKHKLLVSSAIVIVLVILDQLTKIWAAASLRGTPGHSLLGGVVRIDYVENTGAFLSLGAALSQEARTWLFVVGVGIILAVCVYSLLHSAHTWLAVIAFALVIAGGIGNLIDRVTRGSVIDFIYMGFDWLHTGVFNVADMAISLGLVLMLYAQYAAPERKG